MERVLIWAIKDIDNEKTNSYLSVELFSGQNKYTRKGTFSGPLHRERVGDFLNDAAVHFLTGLDGAAQTGKSKLLLSDVAATELAAYFDRTRETALYCRLADGKLYHVDTYRKEETAVDQTRPSYDKKTRTLSYAKAVDLSKKAKTATLRTVPVAKLYLHKEEKRIRGFLTFVYNDIEIEAHSDIEEIRTASGTFLRNMFHENKVFESLVQAGGVRSFRNELTFANKDFFTKTLPVLCQIGVNLYWGEEKRPVSRATISCQISYDMDWFHVSGIISSPGHEYRLSELLRNTRGKNYVELDDGIFFLPEELRRINGKPFEEEEEIRLPLKQFAQVNQLAERFQIDPKTYLEKLESADDKSVVLPKSVAQPLRPYQMEGVQWIYSLYKKGLGGCLADDMGLGKTIQAISFLRCRECEDKLPVLVIAPKVVLYNWANEFHIFAPELNVEIAYHQFPYGEPMARNTVYLTTYETVVNHADAFQRKTFDTVILDEAQYVKNHRTQRYRAIKALERSFTLALSGTPIENNLEELWALMELLNPGFMGTPKAFIGTFGNAYEEQSKLQRLRTIIAPFILRRTKDAVLTELPPKTEQYLYCDMEENQRKLYDTLLTAAKNEIDARPSRYEIKDNAAILQALLYLRETCVDPQLLPPEVRGRFPSESCKFSLFTGQIESLVNDKNKVIVYSQFPRTLQRLEKWCQGRGWQTFYIDGTTNGRAEIVEAFEKAQQGIFFISLKAGGVGLNLVTCQYVILYEPWWNAAAEQQAADRVYRIGQDKPVFIYHFLVRDTIEEKIHELQEKKKILSTNLIDSLGQATKISMEDILELLR